MSVGTKIRTLRTEKGVTLPQLAEKAGVSKGFLSQLENDDKTNPSLDTLSKLADALSVTLADLLEKESVKAKQLRLVPDELDANLKTFLSELKRGGRLPDDTVIQAIYALQHRKGQTPKTKDDWRYLYETVERWLKKK